MVHVRAVVVALLVQAISAVRDEKTIQRHQTAHEFQVSTLSEQVSVLQQLLEEKQNEFESLLANDTGSITTNNEAKQKDNAPPKAPQMTQAKADHRNRS